ncbi:hypothetical protein F4780DRAFT_783465 [Xylariomycetidae sp. FL0641]|nr:hypothetical protein F4780DRAFT_783465 [Xylariomycetidae sp. FL0641]
MDGPGRTLFTVAEIEEQVRHPGPVADFTGKLHVIILEMGLMEHWRKGSTCCVECCGIPLYGNKPTAACQNCGTQRDLALNPHIVKTLIDESGTVAGGELAWTASAWTQLFFGNSEPAEEPNLIDQSWEDITALDNNSLREMEEQLTYSRVTITFGWSSALRRLCILGVEW